MNNTALTLCLSAAIFAGLSTQSYAAGERHGGPKIAFEEVDANADGLLSPAEMEAHRTGRFALADADGNGSLSRAELEARMVATQNERRARFLDRMFERRDANADGELSMAEMAQGRSGDMFSRADANGDGLISKAEFDDVRKTARSKDNRAQ
ncbi:MAG: calcium-binding protein [Pseudomonadota bacterium]